VLAAKLRQLLASVNEELAGQRMYFDGSGHAGPGHVKDLKVERDGPDAFTFSGEVLAADNRPAGKISGRETPEERVITHCPMKDGVVLFSMEFKTPLKAPTSSTSAVAAASNPPSSPPPTGTPAATAVARPEPTGGTGDIQSAASVPVVAPAPVKSQAAALPVAAPTEEELKRCLDKVLKDLQPALGVEAKLREVRLSVKGPGEWKYQVLVCNPNGEKLGEISGLIDAAKIHWHLATTSVDMEDSAPRAAAVK
jgi:hypothetical protein